MDAEQFQAAAEKLLNQLPARFRKAMENVVIVVDDFASSRVLKEMHADSPYDLLGLYEGHPITEREAVDSGMLPDMIHLYRLPILAMQRDSGLSVESCIYDVLIHEIGHYFGFSDAQMEVIEAERGAIH
ncbi:putative Zn-dependent protease, minimal metalloprotease (MMP)-like domain [Mariprofundus ferrinatatus]|uniref:Putative Zn-dependent protease, minimal metalloprotease (MMP)-like domain n=1 Tax=Mariprofundus ferrinatatus TaxID=1921087 RepID=A0A2K8LEC0_9PROT|nr:metallopeptidase family protein [Mariprofundus ferrinatatus]ATX82626.1 putative Zn-dependent protease, minimal metalloprotease (MMP)-like domain [Mariprofundus ferrinatatus]